jgi:PPIC-type PPIASE domain
VRDRIQSWASLLLGAAVVVLVGWLTYDQMSRPRLRAESDGGTVADADASTPSAAVAGDGGGTSASTSTAMTALDSNADGGLSLFNTILGDSGAMPSGAPRTVKLGVVLVQFAGAEGAASSARAKPEALKHALELAEQARADWKGAVKAGDPGSSDDIGRIPRGVLERPTEVAVFSLSAGDISEPLETPRGYWIVKRLE